jgi:hypothetical protein
MAHSLLICLDNPDPGFDLNLNGKYLSKNFKALQKISALLRLKTLEDYVSYSPEDARQLMESLGADPDEIATVHLPEQQWFDAQEGLKLVQGSGELHSKSSGSRGRRWRHPVGAGRARLDLRQGEGDRREVVSSGGHVGVRSRHLTEDGATVVGDRYEALSVP